MQKKMAYLRRFWVKEPAIQKTKMPKSDTSIVACVLTLPGGSRKICMTWHMFPGLGLYSMDTDPVQHLKTADAKLYLNAIDRDLPRRREFVKNKIDPPSV